MLTARTFPGHELAVSSGVLHDWDEVWSTSALVPEELVCLRCDAAVLTSSGAERRGFKPKPTLVRPGRLGICRTHEVLIGGPLVRPQRLARC